MERKFDAKDSSSDCCTRDCIRTRFINNVNNEVTGPILCKKALMVPDAAVTAVSLQGYTWKDGKDVVHLSINHFVLFVLVVMKRTIKC